MKGKLVMLFAAIFITSIAVAQTGSSGSKKTNAPQKGYYAIGNNAEKWEDYSTIVNSRFFSAQKGFYSLKPAQLRDVPLSNPVVSWGQQFEKGFYTLKGNQKKLQVRPSENANYEDVAEEIKLDSSKVEER
jgi:hypothetical protein